MAGIFALEIDGWGEVGNALAITNAEGFADGTFVLTTADTPPTSGEFGAMMWAEDVSVVADGYYTLIARTAATVTLQASSPTVTSTAVTGLARIEDHFRLADGVPSWVTGSDAAARWLPGVQGVTESAGQRIDQLGGLASVDGIEVVHNRARDSHGLAAVRAPSYRLDSVGPVTLAEPLDASSTSVVTASAPIYSGEQVSAPTGAAAASWIGSETVDVRTTASSSTSGGVTEYTQTVTRGVLRTAKRPHAQGTVVHGGLPTPIGQVARVFIYPEGHASHVDRAEEKFRGVCERASLEQLGRAQRVALASSILRPRRKVVGEMSGHATRVRRLIGDDGTGSVTLKTASGSVWGWVLFGKAAAGGLTRRGSTPLEVTADGLEVWAYDGPDPVAKVGDFPLLKRADSDEEWDQYHVRSLERSTGPDPADYVAPILGVTSGGSTVINWYAEAGGIPLAHVFEPVTWARARNAWYHRGAGLGRRVDVNPVDAILQIIVSTGIPGTNGTHDLAPSEFGLGIPEDDIDLDSFTAIGNRLEAEGINAGTISLTNAEEVNISEVLDAIARAYALAITTTTSGRVQLVDMSRGPTSDTTPTITEADLVRAGDTPISVGFEIEAERAVESITLRYDRPWRWPSDAGSQVKDTIRGAVGGIAELFGRVRGEAVAIDVPFAASTDSVSSNALAGRWGRVLTLHRGLVGTLRVAVHPTWAGEIGDIVLATFDQLPDAAGTAGMTNAVVRVIDRIQAIRPIGRASDEVTLLVYGYTDTERRQRRWGPTGIVTAVTDATHFTLKADQYHGADYTSDADSFADDHVVALYEADWTLRGTGGVVDSTTGNDVVLSTSCGGITPNIGDKLTLDEESAQTEATTGWMWLTTDAPGYRWQ